MPKDVSATIDGTVDVGISVLVRSVFVDRSEDVSVAMDESVDVGMVSSACMTEDISKCDVLVDVGIFVVAEDVSEDDELVAAGTLKLVTALWDDVERVVDDVVLVTVVEIVVGVVLFTSIVEAFVAFEIAVVLKVDVFVETAVIPAK